MDLKYIILPLMQLAGGGLLVYVILNFQKDLVVIKNLKLDSALNWEASRWFSFFWPYVLFGIVALAFIVVPITHY